MTPVPIIPLEETAPRPGVSQLQPPGPFSGNCCRSAPILMVHLKPSPLCVCKGNGNQALGVLRARHLPPPHLQVLLPGSLSQVWEKPWTIEGLPHTAHPPAQTAASLSRGKAGSLPLTSLGAALPSELSQGRGPAASWRSGSSDGSPRSSCLASGLTASCHPVALTCNHCVLSWPGLQSPPSLPEVQSS